MIITYKLLENKLMRRDEEHSWSQGWAACGRNAGWNAEGVTGQKQVTVVINIKEGLEP
jgi:hypothetical protein